MKLVYERRTPSLTPRPDWEGSGVAVSAPPCLRNYLRHSPESPVSTLSGFYYSNLDEWVQYKATSEYVFRTHLTDPELTEPELDKFVCWRRPAPGATVDLSFASATPGAYVAEILSALEYVVRLYVSRSDHSRARQSALQNNIVPLTTHKGYPDHTSGYDPGVITACATLANLFINEPRTLAPVWDELEKRCNQETYVTGFIRISGSRKFVTAYSFGEDGWYTPAYDIKGYFCRARDVMGAPFTLSLPLRSYAGWWKGIITQQPQHNPAPDNLIPRLSLFASKLTDSTLSVDSSDFSGFDQSMQTDLQRGCGAILKAHTPPDLAGETTWRCFERLLAPKLMKGSMRRGTDAYLMTVRTGLMSGRPDTSILGNLLNVAILWARARRASGLTFTELARQLGQTWDYQIWGDDATLWSPKKWDLASYTLGYNITAVPARVVFLAKNYTPHSNHTLAVRMWANTINKEERLEPKDDVIAALAVSVRRELCATDPDAYLYDKALRANPKTSRILRIALQEGRPRLERAVAALLLEQPHKAGVVSEYAVSPILAQAVTDAHAKTRSYGDWRSFISTGAVDECLDLLIERRERQGTV